MALFSRKLRDELHTTCSDLRDELDDHLDAINENARDSLEIREALGVFDEKIEKLGARIDELFLLLGAETALSEREKAFVQHLQTPRSIDDLAAWLSVTSPGVERALRVLELKGVSLFTVSGLVTANPALKNTSSLQNYFYE